MDSDKIRKLKKEWLFAKEQEVLFNQKRVSIEQQMQEELKLDLTKSGTIKIDSNFIVTLSHNTKWNDAEVSEFVSSPQNFPMELFPFVSESKWVLNKKILEVLQKAQPVAYQQYIAPLLSVSPRKPSFSVRA